MKIFIIFSFIFVTVSAISFISEEQAWTNFKQNFYKTYKCLKEEKQRLQIFKSNLQIINAHNARYVEGDESYTMAINQFADLTEEEFEKGYLGFNQTEINFAGIFQIPENFQVPASVDWRTKGLVLSVKNQGNCASCWAFSAIAALEGQNVKKHNITTDLSEQELLDCAGFDYGNYGCKGGFMTNSFKYLEVNGISSLSSYPYTGAQEKCQRESHPRDRVKIIGFQNVPSSESALQAAVASVGPISVAVVSRSLRFFKSGIFDDVFCGNKVDHAVLVVGYGEENGKQFWIVKNSWSDTWGENGYIRMSRNKLNQCGIASVASYPLIA